MNCFNHQDKPAVGACKSCLKGLCKDCLTELPNGLACKGSCEDRVNMLNRMTDSNAQVLTAVRYQQRTFGVLSLFLGFGCAVFAVWTYFQLEGSFLPYFIGLVALFVWLRGILILSRKEQFPEPEKTDT